MRAIRSRLEVSARSTPEPLLAHFFDAASSTFTHVVACPLTGRAAVIDPVLDFDARAARTSTESAERVLAYLAERRLTLEWILETHVHADHLSAGHYLRSVRGGRIGIGCEVRAVQRVFVDLFGLRGRVAADGSQFDRLWRDGERITLGALDITRDGHARTHLRQRQLLHRRSRFRR